MVEAGACAVTRLDCSALSRLMDLLGYVTTTVHVVQPRNWGSDQDNYTRETTRAPTPTPAPSIHYNGKANTAVGTVKQTTRYSYRLQTTPTTGLHHGTKYTCNKVAMNPLSCFLALPLQEASGTAPGSSTP